MENRTNEQKLELFADLLEPVAEILSDKEVADVFRNPKGSKLVGVKIAIKNHKQRIIEILAAIDGVKPEEYKVNILSLPLRVLKLANTPEVQELFRSQAPKSPAASSGSAMETTGDGAN